MRVGDNELSLGHVDVEASAAHSGTDDQWMVRHPDPGLPRVLDGLEALLAEVHKGHWECSFFFFFFFEMAERAPTQSL